LKREKEKMRNTRGRFKGSTRREIGQKKEETY